MTISNNKVVAVNYHLSANVEQEAPELIEQTTKETPFVFIFGSTPEIAADRTTANAAVVAAWGVKSKM